MVVWSQVTPEETAEALDTDDPHATLVKLLLVSIATALLLRMRFCCELFGACFLWKHSVHVLSAHSLSAHFAHLSHSCRVERQDRAMEEAANADYLAAQEARSPTPTPPNEEASGDALANEEGGSVNPDGAAAAATNENAGAVAGGIADGPPELTSDGQPVATPEGNVDGEQGEDLKKELVQSAVNSGNANADANSVANPEEVAMAAGRAAAAAETARGGSPVEAEEAAQKAEVAAAETAGAAPVEAGAAKVESAAPGEAGGAEKPVDPVLPGGEKAVTPAGEKAEAVCRQTTLAPSRPSSAHSGPRNPSPSNSHAIRSVTGELVRRESSWLARAQLRDCCCWPVRLRALDNAAAL